MLPRTFLMNFARRGKKIEFDTDEADLTPESIRVIKKIAAILKECPYLSIRIEGHTTAAENNIPLSADRAQVVKTMLEEDHGCRNSIDTHGHGSSKRKGPECFIVAIESSQSRAPSSPRRSTISSVLGDVATDSTPTK